MSDARDGEEIAVFQVLMRPGDAEDAGGGVSGLRLGNVSGMRLGNADVLRLCLQ